MDVFFYYILDILPFDNPNNGLFAYNLLGSTLGGQFVVLFTAGSSSANDMYMAELNGTVTKLTTTTPYVGINDLKEEKNVLLYPIPATDKLVLDYPLEGNFTDSKITIFNLQGKRIKQQSIGYIKNNIDISKFSKGTYLLTIQSASGSIHKMFIKE